VSSAYVYIWEYSVALAERGRFENEYGAGGSWDALFRLAPGFIGTLFLADREQAGRYVTVDQWRSHDDYLAFHRIFGDDYKALDERLESLTTSERLIGHFRA
jgi:heme-degrading monooxygenase HmoA